MTNLLAIVAIMFWAVIPLFWIPVHFFSVSFRRLGLKAYFLPVFVWVPFCFLVYSYRELLLRNRIALSFFVSFAGWILFIAGTFLHVWTARLLGVLGIIGVPEVSGNRYSNLVSSGPFSLVRHPTYLAHTLLFAGVFLISGVISVGLMALVDFLVVNLIIIPLEEKELTNRIGKEFSIYKDKVPHRFFPGIF